MKKTKSILTLMLCSILCLTIATSCKKKDEPTPPDLSLPDKSDIIGTHKGTVSIKDLANGGTFTDNATISFVKVSDDVLSLTLTSPTIKAGIQANNFSKSSETDPEFYFFEIESFDISFNGNEVPQYIKDWYVLSLTNIIEVDYKNFEFGDVKYVTATKELSFIMKGSADIFNYNTDTGVTSTTTTVIEYTYFGLKK